MLQNSAEVIGIYRKQGLHEVFQTTSVYVITECRHWFGLLLPIGDGDADCQQRTEVFSQTYMLSVQMYFSTVRAC